MAQTWDPEVYAANARFVAELGMPLVELLDPQPGERILDLGCGDGALTAKLAALGCRVVGIDASPEQVAATRARGLEAYFMDAQQLPFASEFDAVFSNAVLHWIPRADDVIAGVWRALRPGGRFVGECGGQGNIARIRSALHVGLRRRGIDAQAADPWYFPGADEYRARLQRGGFVIDDIGLFTRPTPLPGDMAGWLDAFGRAFLAALPESERPAFVDEVRAELAPQLRDGAGRWTADYVRLRFAARKGN